MHREMTTKQSIAAAKVAPAPLAQPTIIGIPTLMSLMPINSKSLERLTKLRGWQASGSGAISSQWRTAPLGPRSHESRPQKRSRSDSTSFFRQSASHLVIPVRP